MAAKVSEKKLFLGLLLLTSGAVLITNANLFDAPIRISEKGIVFMLFGLMLLAFSVRLLKRSFLKV